MPEMVFEVFSYDLTTAILVVMVVAVVATMYLNE